jgi:hypothetical protein
MTSPDDARLRWLAWAQQAIGGSPGQIELAAQAAVAAEAEGQSETEVKAAARRAAKLEEARVRWLDWAHRQIGGPPGRVAAAAEAAVAAAGAGLDTAGAVAAARGAARQYQLAHERQDDTPPAGSSQAEEPRRLPADGPSQPEFSVESDQGFLRGQVAGLRKRQEALYGMSGGRRPHRVRRGSHPVCEFRLEQRDKHGGRRLRANVVLSGRRILGNLSNGDWVEVKLPHGWSEGRTLRPKHLTNLTTGQAVRLKGPIGRHPVVRNVLLSIVALAFVGGFIAWVHIANQIVHSGPSNGFTNSQGNGGNGNGGNGNGGNGNGGNTTPPGTCDPGYVPRNAYSGDPVCVTPAQEAQVVSDNTAAPGRVQPGGGAFGPDTCISGYVWRQAIPTDHVCVLPAVRQETAQENQDPHTTG